MSESKRPTASTRSPRKKSRPKAEPTVSEKEKAPVERAEEEKEPERKSAPQASEERSSSASAEESDYDEGPKENDQEQKEDHHPDNSGPKVWPTDEFLLQVYYDKAAKVYIASVLEFPEIRATGTNREGVVRDLENRLTNHLQNLRRRNEPVPEGFLNRKAIERMPISISQSLFKRIEQLSRIERVPMDQLISEWLAAAVERKGEKRHEGGQRPQQHQHPHRDRDRDHRDNRDRENHGNRQQGQGQGQGNRHQPRGGQPRRGYQESLENKENFMEYVRNLEKGNWRKR